MEQLQNEVIELALFVRFMYDNQQAFMIERHVEEIRQNAQKTLQSRGLQRQDTNLKICPYRCYVSYVELLIIKYHTFSPIHLSYS